VTALDDVLGVEYLRCEWQHRHQVHVGVTTRLAMLRWINISPLRVPTISLVFT